MSCPNHPQWVHDREDCPMCKPRKSLCEQEVDRLQQYLFRIGELSEGATNMRHDAAIAHLEAIYRMVQAAK